MNNNISLFGLDRQYKSIKRKINNAVSKCLKTQDFIEGRAVDVLENKLSNYVNNTHCITCGSGTDALLLALMALDVKPGDYVIVPALSFIASADVILRLGAIPIFCDINKNTFCMCEKKLSKCINSLVSSNKKIKAIIYVELFGNPGNVEVIINLSKEYNIPLISDNCQSFGRIDYDSYNKTKSFNADISCTSFFPTKPLGCYGDGGAVFTNCDIIHNKIRSLKHHGFDGYNYKDIGINSRLDTIQAVILLEKLKILDSEILKRNIIKNRYIENLNCSFQSKSYYNQTSAISLFSIKSSKRLNIMNNLILHNVAFKIYYNKPLYENLLFANIKDPYYLDSIKFCYNTRNICKRILSIPCHAYLKTSEIDKIIRVVNGAINE